MNRIRLIALVLLSLAAPASAQSSSGLLGTLRDETGGTLPGVSLELRRTGGATVVAITDGRGTYRFDRIAPGRYELSVTLLNFAPVHREVRTADGDTRLDIVLHLALSADVTVTGKRTFTNLADAEDPAENLVGVAPLKMSC
jgi:hypothetical protein